MINIENNPSIKFANWLMENNWKSDSFYNIWSKTCYHGQDSKSTLIYNTTEELYNDFIRELQSKEKILPKC